MDKMAELETKITSLNCPACMHAELEMQVRCDLGFQDCLYLAVCRNCHFTFDVDINTRTLLEQYPALAKHLRETGCPNCGSIKLYLSMRCETVGKQCFYVATCDLCDYSFRLKGMTGPLPA